MRRRAHACSPAPSTLVAIRPYRTLFRDTEQVVLQYGTMIAARMEVKARMDSVKTALKVLEQLALAAPAGVSDLARAIDAPKSTIQRDLTTLHEAGWIRPVEHQGR